MLPQGPAAKPVPAASADAQEITEFDFAVSAEPVAHVVRLRLSGAPSVAWALTPQQAQQLAYSLLGSALEVATNSPTPPVT